MRSLLVFFSFLTVSLTAPLNVTEDPDDVLANMGLATGVDLVEQVPTETFECFKNAGFVLATVRAYNPGGQGYYDPNAGINIKNGHSVMPMEVYMWPQPFSTKSGSQQFQEMFDGLTGDGVTVKAAWLQVTKRQQQWSPNVPQNVNFINNVLLKMRQLGVRPGIFTNAADWKAITGGWTDHGTDVVLWYYNFRSWGESGETSLSMNDFAPFGGWNQADAKMYGAGEKNCGVVVDKDSFALTQTILDAMKDGGSMTVGYIGMLSSVTMKREN